MITTKIVKTIHVNILTPSKRIINLISETETIDVQFKQSLIIPVHKNKQEMNNNRPVDVVNSIFKSRCKISKKAVWICRENEHYRCEA